MVTPSYVAIGFNWEQTYNNALNPLSPPLPQHTFKCYYFMLKMYSLGQLLALTIQAVA